MSTLGKVLAFVNVFAAIAFVCLAAADWGKRQAWSYAVFRHDLLIHGLPVDDKQIDVDGEPLVNHLSDKTIAQILPSAPKKTQVDEARRRHDDLKREIESDPNTALAKLERTLVPLQRTRGERDALIAQIRNPKV